ncbi:MAG: hypothetical protein M5R40_01135 [Anaerolineae bacterium]|nr:hypothetical protein [Anaerolineae bacterium]
MFDTLARNLDQTARMIDEINWTLNQAEEASFTFQPNESPVIAAEAQWHVQGGDSPEGVLYLTDQRLIFEQKEKKGGFLGIGGQKVQDIAWEMPVGYIENAKSYDEGFFGRKDMIDLALSASAPYGQLVVEVKKGDNDWWLRQINRARTGTLANERVGSKTLGVDEVVLSEAPTTCPNCGGVLPEIVKGMTQLQCAYCSTVIRL